MMWGEMNNCGTCRPYRMVRVSLWQANSFTEVGHKFYSFFPPSLELQYQEMSSSVNASLSLCRKLSHCGFSLCNYLSKDSTGQNGDRGNLGITPDVGPVVTSVGFFRQLITSFTSVSHTSLGIFLSHNSLGIFLDLECWPVYLRACSPLNADI